LGDEERMAIDIERKNVPTIACTDELEHPDFALESYTDPKYGASHIVFIILEETELAGMERHGASTDSQAQQMVHKLLNVPHGLWFLRSAAHEAQDSGGLPHVAPVLGEHTCPHDVLRRQEGEYVLQHPVREVADVVAASNCGGGGRRILGRFPRRHPAARPVVDASTRPVRKERIKDGKRLTKLKQLVAVRFLSSR